MPASWKSMLGMSTKADKESANRTALLTASGWKTAGSTKENIATLSTDFNRMGGGKLKVDGQKMSYLEKAIFAQSKNDGLTVSAEVRKIGRWNTGLEPDNDDLLSVRERGPNGVYEDPTQESISTIVELLEKHVDSFVSLLPTEDEEQSEG